MSGKAKGFIYGAALLGISGLIVKLLGAAFRIPLVWAIGSEGMGYYNLAYPVYSLLLVISTAGLPTAVSKIVAERTAAGDAAGALIVFKKARKTLALTGVLISLALFALSGFIANGIMAQSEGTLPLMAVAPAVFFAAVMSAYRGYFQGLMQMRPTAVSQVLEQAVKLALGLYLAYALAEKGGGCGAAGALIGVSAGEAAAFVYIYAEYKKCEKPRLLPRKSGEKGIGRELFALALPVTLGACVMPVVMTIDASMISRILQAAGYSASETASLYGVLTGVVNPLINMPAVFSVAICMSVVPAVSQSAKNTAAVSEKAFAAMKMALLISLPACALLLALGDGMITFLFGTLSAGESALAGRLLFIMAPGVVLLALIQTATGILQGLSRQAAPVIALIVGAAVKIALTLNLTAMEGVNVAGAAAGTMACYLVAAAADVIMVKKFAGLKKGLGGYTARIVLASAIMGGAAYVVCDIIKQYSSAMGLAAGMTAAALAYCAVVFLTGAAGKSEIKLLPGGEKILRLWERKKR